jgi:soluble lytic murein transglycosylase-like protein
VYRKVEPDGSITFTNIPTTRGFTLIYDELEEEYVTYKEYYYTTDLYDDIIRNASIIYGVEPELIKSVIKTESNFDPYAISDKGACGLMQLIPETAERFNVEDIFDPKSNIYGGTEYLSYLITLFSGDLELALAGYNAGENAVIKYNEKIPPYKETINYVKKVLKFLDYYREHPLSL